MCNKKNCSAGIQTVFTMSLRRSQFLVKNFTNNQITVKFGDNESYSINEVKYSYPIVAPYGHIGSTELRFRAPEVLYATIEDFQQTIVGAKVYYPLATAIEIPLTNTEIAAFNALTTYHPTTIVENNYNTWMKATYKSIESV